MRTTLATLTLILLTAPAAAEPSVCTVSGTKLELKEATVSPRGEETFKVDLYQVAATATLPTRCGEPLTIHMTGPLDFVAKRKNVWLKLTRDVTSADGMVVAKRGARVIDACLRGDRVRVLAINSSDDVLEGENKRPTGVIRDVDVPCDALTLDPIAYPDLDAGAGSDGTDHYWRVRDEVERIRVVADTSPRAPGHVVEAAGMLREIKTKRGWVFGEIVGEGVVIRGWVPTSKLERIPDDEGGIYGGAICTGDHDHGDYTEIPAPGSVDRTGTVRVDARVYAKPGRGEWARFAVATPIKVNIIKGESWARLRGVTGVAGAPWLAGFVPLDTITLDP